MALHSIALPVLPQWASNNGAAADIIGKTAAVASYAAANPGFDPAGVSRPPADPQLQANIAASWHPA